MRLSKILLKTLREAPRESQTISHAYLVRGGYIRPVAAGIYSLLPLGARVAMKISRVIREEMNALGGQEVLMPVVLPRELWEESGRYETVGPELLRFKDRGGKDMVLGMTHEEAVVSLARGELTSYKQLPFMLYQIQTKYRDEARPRAGLIRVREFTMKDGYSFHASLECLNEYYGQVHGAYERIFARLGFKNVVSIESDTGMMGGLLSHEFMAIADCGEDTVFSCSCGYRANKEVARSLLKAPAEETRPLQKIHTPELKTIADLARFLNIPEATTGKAVFYTDVQGRLYFIVIRGDLEVNEAKLRNLLKVQGLAPASEAQITAIGAVPGFASPIGIDSTQTRVIFDRSAAECASLVVGANEVDYHYLGFNFERDVKTPVEVADVATARAGDPCPRCSEPLRIDRGIEIGNIFQLGIRYAEAMNCSYLDQNGKTQIPLMGCYGIGVGRAIAAVIEQSHDQYGPIWPREIAPFEVEICALNYNLHEVKSAAEKLYENLLERGIDVLLDDRNEKAGVAFNDADLIGAPYRIIISPKTLANESVELKPRDGGRSEIVHLSQVVARIHL